MTAADAQLYCIVCRSSSPRAGARTAQVRCNVKAFANESFEVWQCSACRSIHASEEVDLDHYYARYPFHQQKLDFATRLALRSKLRKLEQLGLAAGQRLLDYGCGSGLFVRFLAEHGFPDARGYDAYAKEGPYRAAPGTGYDVVHTQDVIEHVPDPRAFLVELSQLVKPGGLLLIGTPDAGMIELACPERFVHMLHQPYHRHILSRAALLALAEELGLRVVGVQAGFLGNSWFPGINGAYIGRVIKAQGDTLDDTLAGKVPLKAELLTPGAIWDALTGSLSDPGHDMTVALRVASGG